MDACDFLVMGGGSAGYAAARTAAGAGLKTVVVDGARELGGLCILRGCMPSKTLLESSHRYRVLERAGEFGLSAGAVGFDAKAIVGRKRRLIGEFADYRRGQLEAGPFELIRGRAEYVDPTTIRIVRNDGGERMISARTSLIATGSAPAVPAIPGLGETGFWTSDDLLDCVELPATLTVLGGGPIALEMATYCQELGVAVTIVQRSPQLLRGSDPDVATVVQRGLEELGVRIFTGTKILRVERTASGASTIFEQNGMTIMVEGDRILNALGRSPVVDAVGGSGVDVTAGRVVVGPDQRTSRPNIFAAGDVCGVFEVVHIAITQGEIAARNAARFVRGEGGPSEVCDYRLRLFAVFSNPQVATVGATEAGLREAGIAFETAVYPFVDHGKALVLGETAGFAKLIVDSVSREILGASVVGPQAPELIHEVVVAMRFRATAGDLAGVPHYHPTLSEIWTYPAEELSVRRD